MPLGLLRTGTTLKLTALIVIANEVKQSQSSAASRDCFANIATQKLAPIIVIANAVKQSQCSAASGDCFANTARNDADQGVSVFKHTAERCAILAMTTTRVFLASSIPQSGVEFSQ